VKNFIRLIVGLGNHGVEYENTRHNAGCWLVQTLAKQHNLIFRPETKFKGLVSKLVINESDCWLLQPLTYMNKSGESVKALTDFYKISPESILVVHDELDFAPGTIRLQHGGGHGGHNGLKNLIEHLHTNQFYRLRIGIGHPGNKDKVSDYVLNSPTKVEKEQIQQAINKALEIMPTIFTGEIAKAIQTLHTSV
jgi:peptidyl-tRNA hydrolase, PTH1 family